MRLTLLVCVTLAAAFGSCGGTRAPAVPLCTPGQQIGCACPGGEKGVQRCNDDGAAYATCLCPAGGGGSTDASDSGSPKLEAGGSDVVDSGSFADIRVDGEGGIVCKQFDYTAYTPRSIPTLAGQVLPIFLANCATSSSCHNKGARPPNLGDRTTAVQNVSEVGMAIIETDSTEVPSMKYVARGEPQNSYLMRKVEDPNPGCGLTCTPPPGFEQGCSTQDPPMNPRLSAADQATLRDWIKTGATLSTGGGCLLCRNQCSPATTVMSATISDFDGDAGLSIQAVSAPAGAWVTENDGSPRGSSSISVEPCGTTGSGLHFKGSGFAIWGADVGATFITNTRPVDASAYTGISFVLKSATPIPVIVKLQNPDSQPAPSCGNCDAVSGTDCGAGYYKIVASDAVGAPQFLQWLDIGAVGWGYHFPNQFSVDPSQLISILFMIDSTVASFDLCIDDVKFFK